MNVLELMSIFFYLHVNYSHANWATVMGFIDLFVPRFGSFSLLFFSDFSSCFVSFVCGYFNAGFRLIGFYLTCQDIFPGVGWVDRRQEEVQSLFLPQVSPGNLRGLFKSIQEWKGRTGGGIEISWLLLFTGFIIFIFTLHGIVWILRCAREYWRQLWALMLKVYK